MAKSELSSLVGRTSTSEHGKQTQSAGPARLAIGLRLASWSSIQNASSSRLLHDSRDNYLDFHRQIDLSPGHRSRRSDLLPMSRVCNSDPLRKSRSAGSTPVFVLNHLHGSRPAARVRVSYLGWQAQGSGPTAEGQHGGSLSSAPLTLVSSPSAAHHAAHRRRGPIAARWTAL